MKRKFVFSFIVSRHGKIARAIDRARLKIVFIERSPEGDEAIYIYGWVRSVCPLSNKQHLDVI